MKKYVVIVAAGSGQRMNTALPKQFLMLGGRPVLWHTIQAFLSAYSDIEVIVVISEQHLGLAQEIIEATDEPGRIRLTLGGVTRFESVKNGLLMVENNSIIFVHDAVRCLITRELIHQCFEAAVKVGNAIPAIRSADSLRLETRDGFAVQDREKIRIIQTPQTFRGDLLKKAFEQSYDPAFTDEAIVVERSGEPIHLVAGEASNIKITWPIDLVIAETILKQRQASL